MQERGVEPLHLAVQDPKSCASANSATPAGAISLKACGAEVSIRGVDLEVSVLPIERREEGSRMTRMKRGNGS